MTKEKKYINPLRESQYEVLKNINCEDLARKVNELTEKVSSYEKRLDELEVEFHKISDRNQTLIKAWVKEKTDSGGLVSDCCGADFDALGFERPDGLWQEKCLKCGKECEPIWKEKEQPKETDWAEKIKEILTVYFDGGLGRGYSENTLKCAERINDLLKSQESSIREEIGREVRDWYNGNTEEDIEAIIKRITGIKV